MNYPLGVLFGIIVMISWGLGKVIWKKLSFKLNSHTMLLFNYFFMVLFLFIFSAITKNIKLISLNDFLVVILLGFFGFVAILLFFIAFQFTQISLITALTAAYAPIASIIAIYFFKEKITLFLFIGIALVFIGVFLLSLKNNKLKLKSWKTTILLALIISLIWGFFYSFIKIPINAIGAITTSLYIEGFILLFSLIYFLIINKNYNFIIRRKYTALLVLTGFLNAIGAIFFNLSLSYGLILITAPIVSAALMITAIFSRIFLKERLTKKQWVYIIVILSGLILISV